MFKMFLWTSILALFGVISIYQQCCICFGRKCFIENDLFSRKHFGKLACFPMFGCSNGNELENIFLLILTQKIINIIVIPNSYKNQNFHSQHEFM